MHSLLYLTSRINFLPVKCLRQIEDVKLRATSLFFVRNFSLSSHNGRTEMVNGQNIETCSMIYEDGNKGVDTLPLLSWMECMDTTSKLLL